MSDDESNARGWWGMTCWNGLSHDQQRRLIEHGNLPIDYQPEGACKEGAVMCVETMHDEAPGPRFYCRGCAIGFLQRRDRVRDNAKSGLRRLPASSECPTVVWEKWGP